MADNPVPIRRRLPHQVVYPGDSVYFITICAKHRGVNTLAVADMAPLLWDEWRGYRMRGSCFPLLFVVMPDHIHGLFQFSRDSSGLSGTVRSWKRITARRHGAAWQRDFFDHRLRSDESLEEKAAYIRNNPVRMGLATDAALWPYVWSGMDE